MGVIEIGLSYNEMMDLTPKEFYIRQLRDIRKTERRWEQTREILAMIYNTSPGKKSSKSGQQLIELSIDKRKVQYDWDDDLVRKIINAWN